MIVVTAEERGRVELRAAAKVNLFLRVIRRRAHGYHEVETVLQSTGLFDDLVFTPARGFEIESDDPAVPSGEANLIWRAADALRRRYRLPKSTGARIQLRKRIPMGAGLGGGSADAAAALVGLARLWNLPATPEALRALAAELGADVPFFLLGGTAIGRGRGERLTPLPPPAPLWLVLVKPPFAISTADAYQAWRPAPASEPGPSLEEFTDALRGGDPAAIAARLRNDLEAPVCALHPEIGLLRERLLQLGALGARMTGSGSAVFGIARSEEEAGELAVRVGEDQDERFVVRSFSAGG